MSAEERLWWYSRFFDAVEVNSTFYALPSPDTAVPSAIIASGNYSYGGRPTHHYGGGKRCSLTEAVARTDG
jgi:hypothetical protein